MKIHEKDIRSFCFASDFSLLLTCGSEGGKVLDPSTMKVMRVFKQEVAMNAIAVSPLLNDRVCPKHHCIMAGGISARDAAMAKEGGFELHLCNIMYEKEVGQIAGHFGPVNSLVFHKDGRGCISGGEEGNIRLHRFGMNYFEDEELE